MENARWKDLATEKAGEMQNRVLVQIEKIEVEFDTPKRRAINVRLHANGAFSFMLGLIDRRQALCWNNIIPIHVCLQDELELHVYETTWSGLEQKLVGAVKVFVHDIVDGAPILSVRCESAYRPFSIFITRASNGPIERMIDVRIAVRKMKYTHHAVDAIAGVKGFSSELVLNLESLSETCHLAWETLKLRQFDERVGGLVIQMGDITLHVASLTCRKQLPMLKGIVQDLLKLVEDTALLAIGWAGHSSVSSEAGEQAKQLAHRFSELRVEFDRQVVVVTNKQNKEFLVGLLVPGADYDLGQLCLAGTREAIVDSIYTWALDPSSAPLFWLSGPAGCGGTSIASSVCDSLLKAGALAGSFFCKWDQEHLRRPENVVSHIAARIASRCPRYKEELLVVLRQSPEAAKADTKTRYAGLIAGPLAPLRRVVESNTLVVVIDAVDEIGDEKGIIELMDCLLKMSRSTRRLKVLITGRPNDLLRSVLDCPDVIQRNLSGEDERSTSSDIRAYIQSRFSTMHTGTAAECLDKDQVNRLAGLSNNSFIWARIACDLVCQNVDPLNVLVRILEDKYAEKPQKTLAMLYHIALDEALGGVDEDPNLLRQCIGAIVLTGSQQPLSEETLATFLLDHIKAHTLSRLIDRLSAVLYRDIQGLVRIAHKSFRDYLMDEECPVRYRISDAVKCEVAERCLRVMLRALRFNICGLEYSGLMNSEVHDLRARIDRDIEPALRYSCLHWASHLGEISDQLIPNSTMNLLDLFLLGPYSLHWIEVLSLLSQLHTAMPSLVRLLNWTKFTDKKYRAAAFGVYKLVEAAYSEIAASPLCVHALAICFRSVNHPNIQKLPQRHPEETATCNCMKPLLNVRVNEIEADRRICTMAISPDGERVVSGSTDGAVRVWNVRTGTTVLRPLHNHTEVWSVAFSLDGRRVASGCIDGTWEVWDVHTGTALLPPTRASCGLICSMAFSADGRWVVAGCSSGKVYVLNVYTGAMLGYFACHACQVWSVTFSPDGRRIALGSSDKTVKVLDAETCTLLLGPLSGHSSGVHSVAFSSNGCRLVSGSADTTVRLWDAHTGSSLLPPLEGHSGEVSCVAFSPDDRYIASGSWDTTVRVWDANTGFTVLALPGNQPHLVLAVSFSSDGRRIVFGSPRTTASVQGIHSAMQLFLEPENQSRTVTPAIFSLDEQSTALTYLSQQGTIEDMYTCRELSSAF